MSVLRGFRALLELMGIKSKWSLPSEQAPRLGVEGLASRMQPSWVCISRTVVVKSDD